MLFAGLSAASAAVAVNRTKHKATRRSDILDTPTQTTDPVAGTSTRSNTSAGNRREINNFSCYRGGRAAKAGQKALPMFRANQLLAGVPGVPVVAREYASTYHSLPG